MSSVNFQDLRRSGEVIQIEPNYADFAPPGETGEVSRNNYPKKKFFEVKIDSFPIRTHFYFLRKRIINEMLTEGT
jgi:hypothetical protein